MDWTGGGFSAAAGTDILLSRSGRSAGVPAKPSNTTFILLPGTDNRRVRAGREIPGQ
ncbi:hypothetical protein GCM10020256_56180 [Streptomyces thermocoprophilus]